MFNPKVILMGLCVSYSLSLVGAEKNDTLEPKYPDPMVSQGSNDVVAQGGVLKFFKDHCLNCAVICLGCSLIPGTCCFCLAPCLTCCTDELTKIKKPITKKGCA